MPETPTPSPVVGESLPAAPMMVADAAPSATVTASPVPEWVELKGDEIAQFIEASYRGILPQGTGPLRARVENGVLHVDSTVDMDGLKSEMGLRLPAMLSRLVRGETTLAVSGQVVDSSEGIARIRLLSVRVGPVQLPNGLLGDFLSAELERRGLQVEDPLIRPLRLPPAYSGLSAEGDSLRLRRHAPR